MSASSILHFPDAGTITRSLTRDLSHKSYIPNGIAKSAAEFAAQRFADSDKDETTIGKETSHMLMDLIVERCSSAKKDAKKISPEVWAKIAVATKTALKKCANSVKV